MKIISLTLVLFFYSGVYILVAQTKPGSKIALNQPDKTTTSSAVAKSFTETGIKKFEASDYKEALISFNKAIEADPLYFPAYYMRGNTKKMFQDLHGAMKDYNKSIDINPNLSEAYFERGNVKFSLQDYYGAISDYSIAISLNEHHVEALLKRGQAKHQLEAYQDAINDCTKILEINNKNVDAYFLRGILRIEHGQLEKGCLDLSKAGELGDIRAYEVIREKCNQKCFSCDF
jgi:tetratricopeptide (TPR) repeat protein